MRTLGWFVALALIALVLPAESRGLRRNPRFVTSSFIQQQEKAGEVDNACSRLAAQLKKDGKFNVGASDKQGNGFRQGSEVGSGGKMYDIQGDFNVVKVLGSGKTATVFLVQGSSEDRKYAIKCLVPVTSSLGTAVMNQEIRIYQALPPHPNIINFYGMWEYERGSTTLNLMVLELGGPTLEDWTENKTWRTRSTFVDIADQMFTVVNFIGRMGVVHRDLKPDNFMVVEHPLQEDEGDVLQQKIPVTRTGYTLKLFDFGASIIVDQKRTWSEDSFAAWWLDNIQPVGFFLGQTLRPPERKAFSGSPIWIQDMWACGVILVDLLRGQVSTTSECKASKFPCPQMLGSHESIVNDFYRQVGTHIARGNGDRRVRESPMQARLRLRFFMVEDRDYSSSGGAELLIAETVQKQVWEAVQHEQRFGSAWVAVSHCSEMNSSHCDKPTMDETEKAVCEYALNEIASEICRYVPVNFQAFLYTRRVGMKGLALNVVPMTNSKWKKRFVISTGRELVQTSDPKTLMQKDLDLKDFKLITTTKDIVNITENVSPPSRPSNTFCFRLNHSNNSYTELCALTRQSHDEWVEYMQRFVRKEESQRRAVEQQDTNPNDAAQAEDNSSDGLGTQPHR